MLDTSIYPFFGYIGPGAGFAVLGSFLALFAALGLVLFSVLSFPVRIIIAGFKSKPRKVNESVQRVVLLGLDGLDPYRVRQLMACEDLPNMKKLSETGTFCDLATTCPPMSPVAWSSFATGVNPGKHNIFDFMNRNTKTMLPELSSSRIERSGKGKKQKITLLRKSVPFWKILGEHGIFSTILRVPITFPPEKFHGLCLSAMCTPDLRGTQGSFTFFYSANQTESRKSLLSDGFSIPVKMENNSFTSQLPGPDAGKGTLSCRFNVTVKPEENSATISISGSKTELIAGEYSDWIRVVYKSGLSSINGICRFLLIATSPEFKMYVTPVNIDPEHPAMPISYPGFYSSYLAKLHGPFATLGLAEDTWALNEGIIDQTAFLKQTYDIHEERRKMLLESVKRSRKNFVCCVFDLTDRIQHVFQGRNDEISPEIRQAYIASDKLIGDVLALIDDKTVLIVMSDHGFAHFYRGINLNTWLEKEGYLSFKKDLRNGDYLTSIDWSRTKAYSFGLSGIYINLSGRESHGIVSAKDRDGLATEIQDKLKKIKDPATGGFAINNTYYSRTTWTGPYTDNGTDIIVGYKKGYRASWENAAGTVAEEIFSDNTKEWKGDHCIDHTLVPGSLFINKKFRDTGAPPHIMDIAPTILNLFGIEKPGHMDGKTLEIKQ